MSIPLLFAALVALTFLHELGHAAAARLCGLRVAVLSVGFGPAFARLRLRGTEVLFCVVPFGGFVRVPELVDPCLPRPGLLRSAAVTAAGSAANFLAASIMGTLIALTWGADTGRTLGLEVTAVSDHAAAAGLHSGDLVVSAAGSPLRSVEDLQRAFASARGAPLELAVLRGGQALKLQVSPASPDQTGLGARYVPRPELVRLPFAHAVAQGLLDPLRKSAALLSRTRGMLRSRSQAPVGPVGLATRAAQTGRWDARRALTLGSWLSVMVGLFNLLPLPALDGGRLIIAVGEAVSRRRLPPRASVALQLAGAAVLVLAWLLVFAADLLRR